MIEGGKATHRLQWLDYARFFAALSVMLFHYLSNGPGGKVTSIESFGAVDEIARYGYLGVDLFFMISGYVILSSAIGKTADQFAVGRAARLYPAFIVCMTFTTLISLAWGTAETSVSLPQYLANLTILPEAFGYGFVDGVYWTLVVEMAFYAAVLGVIMLGQIKRAEAIVLGWFTLLLVVKLSGTSLESKPLLGDYYVHFAGGALLFLISRDGFKMATGAALPVAIYLSVANAIERAAELEAYRGEPTSGPVVGLIIASFYVLFLAFKGRDKLVLPLSAMIGGLTYPLYLLHAHFGYMVLNRFGTEGNKWLVVSLQIAVVLVLSLLVAQVIEPKTRPFWKRLFDRVIGAPLRLLEKKAPSYARAIVSRR